MPPPYAPPRIDRYEIKSLIGAGGMGTLYLARDTNPNTYRLVALKLLNANLDSEDLRERFGREARSLAALNHPNVVNIYDSGEYQWSPYIVMEYVRGETLAEKIARKATMSIGQKLKLMIELCAGLAHAHEAGIIHRDIKPANLMVDHTGRLRVLDFGIARADIGATRFGAQMTHVNVRIGTPGYMSPEQVEGGDIDTRSDIFAVGAVLYELLAYREAFSGTTTRQVETQVLQSQPAPLTSIVPEIDAELEGIVNKALAKSPAERYQNATDLETALEHVRWRLGLAESTPAGRSTPLPGANVGRKSHESRAETAYQRARAFHEEGAREAAKRYCIEALAEDHTHEAARSLLHEIDPRAWVAEPTPPPSTPVPPTVVAPGTGAGIRPGTRPGVGAAWTEQPTMLSGRPSGGGGFGSEPTMVATRARGSGISDAATVMSARGGASRGFPPALQRYMPIIGVVALVLVTAVVAVLIARWLLAPDAGGMTLTISRPTGGTIIASGIRCGTGGNDCSVTLDQGMGVELQVEADEGFRFAGFTGDCAPGGRAVMTSARTCGATFEEDVAGPTTSAMELLTIAPPQGGTVVAEGIKCGTQGKECTVNRPRGSQITLVAWADKGFTFQGFTGDCTQSGEAHMIAPRTCGATFVKSGVPPPPPGRGTARGGGTTSPPGGTVAASGGTSGGAASSGSSVTPGAGRSGSTGAGETGGISPPPPPKTTAGNDELVAPPKPPPPPPPAEVARKEIQELLEQYRRAYEARSFEALRRVFPTVPDAINQQFKRIRSIELSFMGEPKFVQLDWFTGTAVVEVQTQQTTEMPTGKRPPIEWLERMDLQKRGTDWIIASVRRTQK